MATGLCDRRRARMGRGAPARAIRRRLVPRQAAEADTQAASLRLGTRGIDHTLSLPSHLERVMSRSARRKRGRPYQPLPRRSNPWIARLLIMAIGVLLIFGSLALFTGSQ